MSYNRKFNLKKKLALIIVLFISIGLQAQTTHTVFNTNNSGTGSLRAAAASAVAGDIIRFNPSLIASGSDTIVLTSGEIAFGSKGIIIKGLYNATDTLSISGNNSSRIFSFFGAGRVVLDSLVLINGTSLASGGAISRYNCTDTLFVINSTISGNTAYFGGAIYSNYSSSSTSSCSVSVTNSTISGNTASNNGGAIYSNANNSVYLTLTDSKLSGNISANDGGAIYCKSTSSDSVSITNSTISGNSAISGGGIYMLSTAFYNFSSVSVVNSTISGNTASFKGAGIYAYSYSGCAVGVTNSTVSGNIASIDGGGIYSYSSSYYSSAVTVINSTISSNTAATNGGGIYSFSLTGTSIIITSSSIVAENGSNSSGIYNSQTSTIQSAGYNVFSDSPTGVNPFDSANTTSLQLNLQGLAFNGGSTQTRLPGAGSIAIGNGNPNDSSDAQNGPVTGRRTIGAANTCIAVLSTISVAACSSYTVPSGNFTYSQSGVYIDTLSTVCGADSVVTINLTINMPSTSSITVTACGSYTSPSGNHVWTSSNTYVDTIPNSVNCDSIMTINLTLINATTSTITETHCNSYTSPSGNHVWTSSNTYMDTIPNAANCDSIITINLTINSTTSTITATDCDSYTSPSGNYVWTSSNTYMDTIPNAVNCDSIITINLTINSTTSTLTEMACISYTSPSGNHVWTSSNTYMDTIPNSVNCDSIMTIILTINNPTTATITESACDYYISPSGNYLWTNSNTYMDTISNATNCDSVITINLTIYSSTTSSIIETACDSYTSPSGNHVWTSSNTYMDTIPNAGNCDSIITINLTINNSDHLTDVITACDTYTWIDGITYTTSNNTATATLVNATGCDSIITLDLTIQNSSGSTDVHSECISYTWLDGITYTASNNTATFTVPNTAGCDSVIQLDLTITPVDTSVVNQGLTLTAQATNATYQWIDCTTNTSIPSATNAVLSVIQSGEYAVEVSFNGCVDTSSCYTFINVGFDEVSAFEKIKVYPNPTTNELHIETPYFKIVKIQILDNSGKVVRIISSNFEVVNVENLATGIYHMELIGEEETVTKKFIKQ